MYSSVLYDQNIFSYITDQLEENIYKLNIKFYTRHHT